MKTADEILQEQIEAGHIEHGSDGKAYQIVFSALNSETSDALPPSFINSVVDRIVHANAQKAMRRDYIWLAIGLLGFIIAAIISVVITGFNFNVGAFKFVANYGGLIIFGAVIILLLLWIEKRILPHAFNK